MFCWILNTPLSSKPLTIFCQKLHLKAFIGFWTCLCLNLVRQFWINEIRKACYEETQKNGNKHVLFISGNSWKIFVNFQGKHLSASTFLNNVAGYLTVRGNVFLGNLWNFQNSFYKKTPINGVFYNKLLLKLLYFLQ